jgi:hypothetical protein
MDGLLIAMSGPIFEPSDYTCIAARVLDAIDYRRDVVVPGQGNWEQIYGPSLVDGILDLLLDRASGEVYFLADPGWSQNDFVDALASVATRQPISARPVGLEQLDGPGSHLPPLETVLERFVADRRRLRGFQAAADDYQIEAAG